MKGVQADALSLAGARHGQGLSWALAVGIIVQPELVLETLWLWGWSVFRLLAGGSRGRLGRGSWLGRGCGRGRLWLTWNVWRWSESGVNIWVGLGTGLVVLEEADIAVVGEAEAAWELVALRRAASEVGAWAVGEISSWVIGLALDSVCAESATRNGLASSGWDGSWSSWSSSGRGRGGWLGWWSEADLLGYISGRVDQWAVLHVLQVAVVGQVREASTFISLAAEVKATLESVDGEDSKVSARNVFAAVDLVLDS